MLSIRRALLLLVPCVMLIPLAMDIFVSGVPAMMDSLHTTKQNIQWVLILFMLASGIGQPLFGPICDIVGRRNMMLFAIALFVLSSFACAKAPNLALLSAARFFEGLGACAVTVATFAIVRDSFTTAGTYRVFSFIGAATAIMPMLAPLFGSWLMAFFGSWRICFSFLAGFGLIVFALIAKALPETKPDNHSLDHRQLMQVCREILLHPVFIAFTVSGLTAMTQLYLYFSVGNFLLIRELDLSEGAYSLFFGLNALVYLLGGLLSTRIQRAVQITTVVHIGCSLVFLGSLCMFLLEQQFGLTASILVGCNILMTLGVGIMTGPSTGGAIQSFPQAAATASGLFGFVQYVGAAFIGFLVTRFDIVSANSIAIPMLTLSLLTFAIFRLTKRTCSGSLIANHLLPNATKAIASERSKTL